VNIKWNIKWQFFEPKITDIGPDLLELFENVMWFSVLNIVSECVEFNVPLNMNRSFRRRLGIRLHWY